MEIIKRQFSEDHKYLYTKWSDGSITGEPITEQEYKELAPYIYDY